MNNLHKLLCSFLLLAAIPLMAAAESQAGLTYSGDFSSHSDHGASSIWQDAAERGLRRAINPDDYICSSPTDLDLWVDEQYNQIDGFSLFTMFQISLLYWSFDAKLLVDHDPAGEYLGVNGEHSRRQFKTFADNRRFWDIDSDDILLMGGHGAVIADDELMAAFFPIVFGGFNDIEQGIILAAARAVIEGGLVDMSYFAPWWIFEAPGIPGGYGNPLLTLNALAFSAEGQEIFPGSGIIPDKIIMGDGLMDALRDIGLGMKEGPDFILAHEFAHHVQFEIGAFEPGPPAPEKTRRTELMADSFAAYYSSHARGNTFQAKRFADVVTAAYEVGDCSFSSNGHHGTHLQRLNAAHWGQMISEGQRKQGHIYASESLLQMFDADLPALVAPDAP